MGVMLQVASETNKAYYSDFVCDKKYSDLHRDGYIHIHDFDFYSLTLTCCQIPIEKLLLSGFSTGHGFLRTPNSILSASANLAIAMQANQNDQHGGQSIATFDYSLAPFVAKEYIKQFVKYVGEILEIKYDLTFEAESLVLKNELMSEWEKDHRIFEKMHSTSFFTSLCRRFEGTVPEVSQVFLKASKKAQQATEKTTHQAMEALIHNLNTMHSRAGAQTPFTSINYGTDTSWEGRLVTRMVLIAENEGLGHGETPIFPIHIFKVKEGVNYNPEDPNYDLFKLACKVSAKRLFPNFSFLDSSYNKQYYVPGRPETEVAYMGCRTRTMGNVFDKTREIAEGRGNLSFTSMNLPRLAIEAKEAFPDDEEKRINLFYDKLTKLEEAVFGQLLERFNIVANLKVKNMPFLMGQGVWLDSEKLELEDKIGEVIKHGSLTVGFIGLAETLTELIGKHHGESEKAQKLGLEIVGKIRSLADEKAKETGLNFAVIATPAEGLSGRFVRMDRKRFGVIEGVTDKEYYTNSFHIPVGFPINAFDKIRLEAPYHNLTNGGHISYVEMDGDPLKNLDAFEAVIRCMKENGIGYGSINHPIDRCPDCGYQGIINEDECPQCGSKSIERIRRITGYLVGTMDRWNDAKKAEEHDRVKHSAVMERL